jgi:rhodanese-related sulfurtransferase
MKIAVPSREGLVDEHFGHCKEFLVFNVEGGKLFAEPDMAARTEARPGSFGPSLAIPVFMRIFLGMRSPMLATLLLVSGFALGAAPTKVPTLPPLIDEKGLLALIADKGAKALLVDVRTLEEFDAGHIPGAILLPYDELAAKFKEADKGHPIVVYCRSGHRSGIAKTTLLGMGYTNVSDFGAYTKWTGKLVTK